MSKDPKLTRGYTNKNPANLEYNERNKWQGQLGIEVPPAGATPRFAVFESHEFGIRALAVLLITYFDRHNLRTIRGVIDRWAPPSENNTDAYVNSVCRRTGFAADTPLDLHQYRFLRPLVEAIIHHELGGNPYEAATIDEGLRLAGVPRPVHTFAEAATTPTGSAAITVGAAATAATVVVQVLRTLGEIPPYLSLTVIVSTTVLCALWVLNNRTKRV